MSIPLPLAGGARGGNNAELEVRYEKRKPTPGPSRKQEGS